MKPTWQQIHDQPALLARYLMRERVIQAIRAFFAGQGFHEVETPLLVPVPSMEPYLEVFETEFVDAWGQAHRAFLTNSPEYAMKRLLVAGLPRIYQICKAFRNGEDTGPRRNPEFTMLEWYRAHADYTDIMRDCENLLLAIYRATRDPDEDPAQSPILQYQGMEVDLTPPWERITVRDALARYAGVDLGAVGTWDALAAVALAKGYTVPPGTTWDEMLGQIFANEVEPHLGAGHPTILYDYPVAWAGLSRTRPDDPQTAERFEFYIASVELGNAFSELTDAAEQAARLEADRAQRAAMGKKAFPVDHDFLAALAAGMPPTGGIAVGVDRLVMLFADVPSIHDTLWMPGRELFAPHAVATDEED